MRVFVTGASGHIAWAVVPELIRSGHEVVGLARSENSAATVKALGAGVHRGDLRDLDGLREAVAGSDAVIHLAFDHAAIATGHFADAAAADLAVVRTLGEALSGTGKTLIGIGATRNGDPEHDAAVDASPRAEAAHVLAGFAERDVRSLLVAIPPVTHSARDSAGFIPRLIGIARETGVSGYVGDGGNRWSAAHALDVGRLYRLALEKAPAGSELCAAAEEGITVREVAEIIGRRLGIPVESMSPEKAAGHFSAFPFITFDMPMNSAETRRLLGWEPVHPGLIAELEDGHYFTGG